MIADIPCKNKRTKIVIDLWLGCYAFFKGDNMRSKIFRAQESFLRPCFISSKKYDIPFIEKQELSSYENLSLIGFNRINNKFSSDTNVYSKGVHFFLDDYHFERAYKNPRKYIANLSKFAFVLTPDFSLYAERPMPIQINEVFKSRWCGSCWQRDGLTVIPAVSWGLPPTFDFCFEGIEEKSTVAISTVGCGNYKAEFMAGYNEMMNLLRPEHILCFGKPFDSMVGNIHVIPYSRNAKEF